MRHSDHDAPSWRTLAERHDAAPDEDFPGWNEALERLAHDDDSLEEAIDADPLFLFQRLPAPEVDAADVEAMKASVANLRRTAAVDVASRSEDRSPRRRAHWRHAAVLALAVLGAPAAWLLPGQSVEPVIVADTALSAPALEAAPPQAGPAVDLAAAPLVEDFRQPADSMMQIENDQISMVVVWAGDGLPVLPVPPQDV